jgi:hypothetical protein
MLSLLAVSYNTMRLGLEAQNAAAFRLLRLAVGASKRRRTPLAIVPPASDAPTEITIAPKKRLAAKKIHKKSAGVRARIDPPPLKWSDLNYVF